MLGWLGRTKRLPLQNISKLPALDPRIKEPIVLKIVNSSNPTSVPLKDWESLVHCLRAWQTANKHDHVILSAQSILTRTLNVPRADFYVCLLVSLARLDKSYDHTLIAFGLMDELIGHKRSIPKDALRVLYELSLVRTQPVFRFRLAVMAQELAINKNCTIDMYERIIFLCISLGDMEQALACLQEALTKNVQLQYHVLEICVLSFVQDGDFVFSLLMLQHMNLRFERRVCANLWGRFITSAAYLGKYKALRAAWILACAGKEQYVLLANSTLLQVCRTASKRGDVHFAKEVLDILETRTDAEIKTVHEATGFLAQAYAGIGNPHAGWRKLVSTFHKTPHRAPEIDPDDVHGLIRGTSTLEISQRLELLRSVCESEHSNAHVKTFFLNIYLKSILLNKRKDTRENAVQLYKACVSSSEFAVNICTMSTVMELAWSSADGNLAQVLLTDCQELGISPNRKMLRLAAEIASIPGPTRPTE